MKKNYVIIIILICLAILLFVGLGKAKTNLDPNEALRIGEEKYLKFLWMVDGAFNSEKYGEYIVNDKKMDLHNQIFKCTYKKKSKTCISENFESEFMNTFASNINYDNVYSDGIIYKWYSYEKGKYLFNNLDNCSVKRMPNNQKIRVKEINNNEIIYTVSMPSEYDMDRNYNFVLVLENGDWKVSEAYYYDLCGIDYYIE